MQENNMIQNSAQQNISKQPSTHQSKVGQTMPIPEGYNNINNSMPGYAQKSFPSKSAIEKNTSKSKMPMDDYDQK